MKSRITAVLFFAMTVTSCYYYRDEFAIAPPDRTIAQILFPGLMQFRFTQDQASSPKIASDKVSNAIKTTNLGESDSVRFLVRIFSQSPFLEENLLYRNSLVMKGDSMNFPIGNSFTIPLTAKNFDVRILESGMGESSQSPFRGFFRGTFSQSKGTEQVAVGTVAGFVDYKGNFQFEFENASGFVFFKGSGITGATSSDFLISSTLTDRDGKVITPLESKLSYTKPATTGTIPVTTPAFDNLIINLTKK